MGWGWEGVLATAGSFEDLEGGNKDEGKEDERDGQGQRERR